MGKYYAQAQARTSPLRTRSRITTARKAGTISCRLIGLDRGRACRQDRHAHGFWAIDEKADREQGSYALRRAALASSVSFSTMPQAKARWNFWTRRAWRSTVDRERRFQDRGVGTFAVAAL